MLETVLTTLYGISGTFAVLMYIPQIIKYHRSSEARSGISLISYGGWLVSATVAALYAFFVAKDMLISSVFTAHIFMCSVVVYYGIRGRREVKVECL